MTDKPLLSIAERLRDWQGYEPIKKFASGLPPDLEEAADEIERLRGENERLRGHIYASNRPQPEDFERLRKLLDACRGAMRVTQQAHPNATDWRGMIAAIDGAIGDK
jgi:ribosomal 50S subunit-associated protein YjgA (DUF615 family)